MRQLLAILPWLAGQGRVTTAHVAERFGLSEDEVVGLLELAACCGLPPYTPDQLMELIVSEGWVSAHLGDHLSRPQRLTPAEGFTLAASARAILAVPGADPDGALARALAKLEAVLGAKVVVDLDEPPLLVPVRRAAAEGQSLDIDYYAESKDELTRRRVDPRAVFAREGHWYLEGWCHLANGRRLFRVDRIRSAEPAGEERSAGAPRDRGAAGAPRDRGAAGDIPTGGVPAAFVPGSDAREVTLAIPAGARWVCESYPTRAVDELEDGRLRVVLAVGGEAWLERLLLRLGPDAQVWDPPGLAQVGRRAASRLLAGYGP